MEEKKTKNLVSIIVVLILIIVILCVTIAYLLHNDNNKKDSNSANIDQISTENPTSNENNNDSIISLNIEDDYIKDMYKNMLSSNYSCYGPYIYHTTDKMLVSDIPYSVKMEISAWIWLKEYRENKKSQSDVEDVNGYNNEFIVPEYRIKEKYIKLFGDNYPKNDNDKNTDGCPGTKYSNGKYNIIASCGDTCRPEFGSIIYKAEKNENLKEIYIYDKIYIPKYFDSTATLFGDFNKEKLIRKSVEDNIIGTETLNNSFTPEEKEKMDTYKFTFKENSDATYRFVSSEKVK